jgi:siroheme synthase-like protein
MPVDGPLYPVNLRIGGRRCLVVGGGAVAAGKAEGLLAAGAEVRVVAVEAGPEVRALAGVVVEERSYEAGEIAGYHLAIAATGDPAVDAQVHADGEASGVWVNSADDPEHCSFVLPARFTRGHLQVTVSTGGHSPAVSSWLRTRLEAQLGPEYGVLVDILSEERSARQAAGQSTEVLDWRAALESEMLDLIREGRLAEAKERLQACLSSSSA